MTTGLRCRNKCFHRICHALDHPGLTEARLSPGGPWEAGVAQSMSERATEIGTLRWPPNGEFTLLVVSVRDERQVHAG
jgi:hypothetical protein